MIRKLKSLVRRAVGERAYIWLGAHKKRKWMVWLWVLAGREIWPRVDIQRPTEMHGSWCLCPSGLNPDSIVYSVGVGTDIAFDLSLIQKYGLTVHAFDPTPKSLAWVRTQTLPAGFRLHEFGLADYDGVARFRAYEDPGNPYYTLLKDAMAGDAVVEAPVRRLATLMKTLGHDRIDLLKIDIEGAEFAVIDDLAAGDIRVGQLLVEFHHRMVGAGKTRKALRLLREKGFRVFHVSKSLAEYSLIRV